MNPDAPQMSTSNEHRPTSREPPFVTHDELRTMLQTEVAAVVKETLTTLRVNPSVAKDGSSGAPITLGTSN